MSKTYTMRFGSGDPRTYTGLAPTFLIYVNAATGATVAPPAISEALASSGLYKFTWGTTTPIAFLADAATTSPGTSGRYVSGQIDPADRSDEYGTTMIAIGTTLIGYGASTVAFGSTLFGIGTSQIAQGVTLTAIGTTLTGYGMTNFALGTTSVALGTTAVALGTTSVALGTTSVALGTTSVALGITSVAIGTSLIAQGITLNAIGISLYGLIGTTSDSFGSTSVDPTTLFGFLKRSQEFWEGNEVYTKASGLLDFYSRGSSTLLKEKTISDTAASTTKT